VTTTAASDVTITKPSGTAAGDVLVACLTLNGGQVATTGVPAGWSRIAGVTGVANPHVFGYSKVATATEPASYRWALGSAVTSGAGIARYSGASGLDAAATTASGASGTTAAVPAPATTRPDAMLVGCMGVNSASTATTIASPNTMGQAWDIGGKRHELADGLQPTAGASESRTWTFNVSRAWAGWLAALRPG
jgi:hypothetical protein